MADANDPRGDARAGGSAEFNTTHWSVVLAAADQERPEAAEALETLCRTYWYPLYAFVRREGHSPHDTEDLLQGFFARFLEKHYLGDVNQAKGRFRSFLLSAMKHYLADQWDKAHAVKRGGRIQFVSLDGEPAEHRYREEVASELTPERLYEQRWACALLERVMARLEQDFQAAGKGPLFTVLVRLLPDDDPTVSYAELAVEHGLSEGALRMKVQRLRRRYQRLLREEIAHTVASPEDVDDEIRWLFSVVSGS